MRYRRARTKGETYFFTVITFKREEILTLPENVELLREAFRYVMGNHPFTIDAFVLLPDHLHCIWTLPRDDRDFSMRWRRQKIGNIQAFTGTYALENITQNGVPDLKSLLRNQ